MQLLFQSPVSPISTNMSTEDYPDPYNYQFNPYLIMGYFLIIDTHTYNCYM